MPIKKHFAALLLFAVIILGSSTGIFAASVEKSGENEWKKYSTNYIYNLLEDEERVFWDEMDNLCMDYMLGTKNFQSYQSFYVSDKVTSETIPVSRLEELAMFFVYSNPQYYFLQNNYFLFSQGNKNGVMLCAYSAFADGRERAAATISFKKKIDEWSAAAIGLESDEKKAKALHDTVCMNTVYNKDAIDESGNVIASCEDAYMTQSAYSAMCMGTSVCAGYTKAYAILCNGVGLDALVISSPVHAWNKVRLNDSWYNIDCTFDDADNRNPSVVYDYFARNDQMNQYGLREGKAHFAESTWKGVLPLCTLDSNSTLYEPGELPTVTQQAGSVQILVEEYTEQDMAGKKKTAIGYKVSLSSATPGARIYYTIDGTIPSEASTKSYLYTGPFLVYDVPAISAVAVCDQMLDSPVAVTEDCTGLSYDIIYELNGGKNNKKNPKEYSYWDSDITLKAPKKTGYKFVGWYTDSAYKSQKVKTIVQNNVGTIYLYAKWTPIKYKIKFMGNGATSGSMNGKNCKYGKSYRLPENAFQKKGYTFIGWSTSKDGKGTLYKDASKIKNLSSKNGKTITLYAQWEKK